MGEDSSKTYVPPPSAGSSGMKSPQSQRNEAMQSKYKEPSIITTTDKDTPSTPSRLSPGMIGGKQVVQSAHTDLDDPVSSPHLNSPVNPFIHYRPASDKNIRSNPPPANTTPEKDTPIYTPEEQVVKSQLIGGGSETLMYQPEERAAIMENIKAKEQLESASAMQLGGLEQHAQKYEENVADKLEPLTGSSIGPVRALGGAVESVAYIPTAIPRLAVGLVRDPSATVRGATQGLAETVVTDPWRGGGQIVGMVKGPALIAKAAKYGPKINKANIVTMDGGGSFNPVIGSTNYGLVASIADYPIITYVKGKGLVKGAGGAPAELLQGKTATAFSARETALFRETVTDVGGSIEGQYFGAGYEIAKGISKQKNPVVESESFKVTSEHVPDIAKPFVEKSIRDYPGDIQVYGSASQKLQMGDYMKRMPQDIEVIVDNPANFASLLKKNFEGTNVKYNVRSLETGKPKVDFITDQGTVKGIEIFGRDAPIETAGGYKPTYDIAYGFKSQKPITIDGVSMMRLSEQGPRKFAGGNVLKDGSVEPMHAGRMKDVGDLIDIGTAFEITKGIGIESSLIKYSKIAKQKGATSSVMDFIVENKRVPTKSEFTNMLRDPADVIKIDTPDLLYSSGKSSSASSSLRSSPLSSVIVNKRSSPPSYIMSELDSSLSVISSIKGPSQPPSSIFEASLWDMGSPSPSRSSSSRSSPSPSSSPPSSPRAVTPMGYIPSIKIKGVPQVSNPRPKGRSKRSSDDLDIFDKNLFNKYNDPLKTAAAVDMDVQKMLRRGL